MREKIAEIIRVNTVVKQNSLLDIVDLPVITEHDIADQILALIKEQVSEFSSLESLVREQEKILSKLPSLDGIVVEEECEAIDDTGTIPIEMSHLSCPKCHGTGTITRQAEWGDILELAIFMLTMTANDTKRFSLDDKGRITFLLKSGGRLRVKE